MNLVLFQPGDVIALNAEAQKLIEDALEPTALIGKVSSADQQQAVVPNIQAIDALADLIEKLATEEADPSYRRWETIHTIKRDAIRRLRNESARLNGLCGDFQQLDAARLQSAIQAQQNTLNELERQRAAERAKATSHEELDAIDFRMAAMAQAQAPAVIAPPVANGQKVKRGWVYTVTDALALWKIFPQCVKPSFVDSEIKDLLDLHKGILPGVDAKSVIISKVRKYKEQKPLDV